MWEIRKVWVAQPARNEIGAGYVGESQERAEKSSLDMLAKWRRETAEWVQGITRGDERPHVEAWMVAVRFDGAKTAEIIGLVRCPYGSMPDGLAGAEIDITRGA